MAYSSVSYQTLNSKWLASIACRWRNDNPHTLTKLPSETSYIFTLASTPPVHMYGVPETGSRVQVQQQALDPSWRKASIRHNVMQLQSNSESTVQTRTSSSRITLMISHGFKSPVCFESLHTNTWKFLAKEKAEVACCMPQARRRRGIHVFCWQPRRRHLGLEVDKDRTWRQRTLHVQIKSELASITRLWGVSWQMRWLNSDITCYALIRAQKSRVVLS